MKFSMLAATWAALSACPITYIDSSTNSRAHSADSSGGQVRSWSVWAAAEVSLSCPSITDLPYRR